jgi:hypothetical protein
MLHYESTPNFKTCVLVNVFKNLTAVYGFAAEVGLIRDAVIQEITWLWANGEEVFQIMEIQTKCENGHNLKRFDAPYGKGNV